MRLIERKPNPASRRTTPRVMAIPFEDANTLGELESKVLRMLDPPLVGSTEVRVLRLDLLQVWTGTLHTWGARQSVLNRSHRGCARIRSRSAAVDSSGPPASTRAIRTLGF